jgi:hypothetical protein
MGKRTSWNWHYAPEGKACCGRRKMRQKARTLAGWSALPVDDRCNDCDRYVKRDGKPRGEVWIGVVTKHAHRMTPESVARDLQGDTRKRRP